MQHFYASDISSILAFANWMNDRLDIADTTWISDKAHLHLNGEVNTELTNVSWVQTFLF